MTTGQLDTTYEQLRRAADRVSDNLLELELDPIRAALDGSELDGASADRWAAATAALVELWEWYGELDRVLERAAELRSRRGADAQRQLEVLLLGTSVVVERRNVPLEERTLVGEPVATTRTTPADLLTRMSAAFDGVKSVLGTMQRAWEELRPRVAEAARSLDGLTGLQAALGTAPPAETERLRADVAAAERTLATDPLALDPAAVDSIQKRVRALHDELDALATLRRTMPERVAQARATVTALRTEEQAAAHAQDEARTKIADARIGEIALTSDALADDLDRLDALLLTAAWQEARDELEAWTRRAAEARASVAAAAEDAAVAIRTRNELRGLLDAYGAKARALRRLEDPEVHALFERARDVLYTAPTDLHEAWRRVRAYQQVLDASRRELV